MIVDRIRRSARPLARAARRFVHPGSAEEIEQIRQRAEAVRRPEQDHAGERERPRRPSEEGPARPAKKGKRARDALGFRGDERFQRVAERVMEDRRTFLGYERLFVLWQAVNNVYRLGLPAAEIGAYKGGSSYFIASAFLELAGRETPLYVFDTFEGHPESKMTELDVGQRPGDFVNTSYEAVKAYLAPFAQVRIHQGEFSQAVRALPELTFGLVHVDVDLYRPTLDCLEYFEPRLATGGVVVIDDYWSPTCPGVRQALGEHLAEGDRFQIWYPPTEQVVLVKR